MNHIFSRMVARPLRACAAVGLVFCAAFASPAMFAAAAAPGVDVVITKFAFTPKEITVVPGTKVTWTNKDETPHTVTSNDKSFASKGLDTDDKFEHTFASEGDFTYFCTLHPFMTGIVHVHKR